MRMFKHMIVRFPFLHAMPNLIVSFDMNKSTSHSRFIELQSVVIIDVKVHTISKTVATSCLRQATLIWQLHYTLSNYVFAYSQ